MNKPSMEPSLKDRLTLRGLHDKSDYEIIAQIRNDVVREMQGNGVTLLSASSMEGLIASPDQLCIAQIDQDPVGYLFVAKAGRPQLDEFGTVEGKSWLFYGPSCAPKWQGKGIEQELVTWLVTYGRAMGIGRLIKFSKTGNAHQHLTETLTEIGFKEKLRYHQMRLTMTAPPPPPRELPSEFDLINYQDEKDFDTLWSVLELAFDYLERDSDSYEQDKAIFGSMESAYFPICLESVSGKAIGTIALVSAGNRCQVATFGVIPSFQKKGIGSLLMERAIDHAWQLGAKTIDFSVRVENPQAINIYRRFGFQTIPGQTTIVFLKDI